MADHEHDEQDAPPSYAGEMIAAGPISPDRVVPMLRKWGGNDPIVDEDTGLVQFVNDDGDIVAEGKLKPLARRRWVLEPVGDDLTENEAAEKAADLARAQGAAFLYPNHLPYGSYSAVFDLRVVAPPPRAQSIDADALLAAGRTWTVSFADDDVQDSYTFLVAQPRTGEGLSLDWSGCGDSGRTVFLPTALEAAKGIVFFSQGTAFGGEEHGSNSEHATHSPSFLLSRDCAARVAAGLPISLQIGIHETWEFARAEMDAVELVLDGKRVEVPAVRYQSESEATLWIAKDSPILLRAEFQDDHCIEVLEIK